MTAGNKSICHLQALPYTTLSLKPPQSYFQTPTLTFLKFCISLRIAQVLQRSVQVLSQFPMSWYDTHPRVYPALQGWIALATDTLMWGALPQSLRDVMCPLWTASLHLLAERLGTNRGRCQMDGGPVCLQSCTLLLSVQLLREAVQSV